MENQFIDFKDLMNKKKIDINDINNNNINDRNNNNNNININNINKEDDEDKLSQFPIIHTFSTIMNKYIIKLSTNKGKNKCLIYASIDNILSPYYYFFEGTKEDLINVNQIFNQLDNVEEIVKFFDKILKEKNTNDNVSKCTFIFDDEAIRLNFKVNTYIKEVEFNIYLVKKMKNKLKFFDATVKKVNELTNENNELKEKVSNLEAKVNLLMKKMSIGNINIDLYDDLVQNKNSKIVNIDNIESINDLMHLSKNNLILSLYYSATTNGDNIEAFLSIIENKDNIFIIVKTKSNAIFGGFFSKKYQKQQNNSNDDEAFLFDLTKKKIYNIKENKKPFECTDNYIRFINGFSLANNFLSSKKNYTKTKLNCVKTWGGFQKDYELNDGNEYFEVEEMEAFKIERKE